ncbi:MAG: hypothetical protein ABIQ16_16235, partial [Polyangiaceae bacterium]
PNLVKPPDFATFNLCLYACIQTYRRTVLAVCCLPPDPASAGAACVGIPVGPQPTNSSVHLLRPSSTRPVVPTTPALRAGSSASGVG